MIMTMNSMEKLEHYNITFEKGKLIVSPRPITFTWNDEDGGTEFAYEYDGNSHHVTAIPVTVNGDKFIGSVIHEGNNGTDVGEYEASVVGLPDEEVAKNYVLKEGEPTASQPWDINIATNSWKIVPAIEGWKYGETPKTPTAEAKFGDSSKKFSYRLATSSEWSEEIPTQAGEYEMKVTVEGTDNYSALETEVSFTIEKASIRITAEGEGRFISK